MDRTERLYKISELLRANKAVSFATLLGKLQVSRSTPKRDLYYLSTRFNNPVVYCRELGGYRQRHFVAQIHPSNSSPLMLCLRGFCLTTLPQCWIAGPLRALPYAIAFHTPRQVGHPRRW